MSWSKRDIVTKAYSQFGYASYEYDLDPAELAEAMSTLDMMMAMFSSKGIRLGYLMPDSKDGGNLDDQSGIPDTSLEAVVTLLAARLAPTIGKMLSPDQKAFAKVAYDQIMNVLPPKMVMPSSMPRGSGNKSYDGYDVFFTGPVESIDTGTDGKLDI